MLNRSKGIEYFMCVIGKAILRTEALALRTGLKQSINYRAALVFMGLLRSLISTTQPKPADETTRSDSSQYRLFHCIYQVSLKRILMSYNDGFIGNVDRDDDDKISSKAVI